MNKNIKDILFSILGIAILGSGVALMMKANIGLAAWDMVAVTLGNALNITEGTGSMIANFVLLIVQIILLGRSFKKSQYLQVFVILFFGAIIDFFLYNIYTFNLGSYPMQLVAFIIGIVLTSLGVSILVVVNFITMPTEAFSAAVAVKSRFTFNQVRLAVDVVSIIVCTILTFVLNLPPTLREGTIIGMIVFNSLIKVFINLLNDKFKK